MVKEKILDKVSAVGTKVATASAMATMALSNMAMATDVTGVTDSINALKEILVAICGAVGAITIVVSVIKYNMKGEERDQLDNSILVKGIIGGGLALSISVLLGIFGVK